MDFTLVANLIMVKEGWELTNNLFRCAGHGTNSVGDKQPQVFTAKCSEPQVVNSDVEDGGSGVAILSSVRTET